MMYGFDTMYMGVTTIRLHDDTKERLCKRGDVADSYDDVVRRLLEETGRGDS